MKTMLTINVPLRADRRGRAPRPRGGRTMMGRRRPDVRLGDLPEDVQPGDIWKYLNGDGSPVSAARLHPGRDMSGNLTGGVWGFCSPDGNGIGTLALHTVREHDDGTVSVQPGDGSSNSILHTGGGQTWHGYIDHNDWQAC